MINKFIVYNNIPYVYRLDHPITGEFYIRFRSANKVPPEQDIGIKYFTSSKYVKPRFHEFTATIIAEFFDTDAAYEFEQELIFEAWGTVGLLNKRHTYGKGAFNNSGRIASAETKQKISEAKKNISIETRRKLSAAKKGKPLQPKSDEHRKKLSATARGKPKSNEAREKMSESRKGKPRSDETKRKISVSMKGHIVSDETRQKMSEANKGRPVTVETRKKLSEANKGRPPGANI